MLQLVKGNEGFYRKKFEEILWKRMGYERKVARNFVRLLGQALNGEPGTVSIQPTADGKISIFFSVKNPKGESQSMGVALPPEYVAELYLQVE